MLRKIVISSHLILFSLLIMNSSIAKEKSKEASAVKSKFENLELFNKVLHLVESQYYREVDTAKLVEGAIKGMLETLDPHSAFLNEEFFKKMQDDTSGEFGGLGLEVTMKDGILYVVTPIDDTPAYREGIKSKDKIVEIDHESIVGWTLDQAIEKMKGKENSKVHIGIIREGEKGIKSFELKREKIQIKPVKSFVIKDEYIFIRLTQFQKRSASSIVEAIEKHKKEISKKKLKLKGYILDLRSNPGGLLDQAVEVSSLFLEDGVVVSTEARDKSKKDIHYVKKSGFKDIKTPLIVLVNGASASASEIVAGAIQDFKRGAIAGSQTFGKGSVQTVAQIDKTSGVKLTIAQYMTPLGRKIQAVGIKPDIEISEYSSRWNKENESEDNYLREKDLKNHLSATIETKEEKEMRENQERLDKIKRAKEIAERKKKAKNSKQEDDDLFRKYDPQEDFQVMQAVSFLQSLNFYKSVNTKK